MHEGVRGEEALKRQMFPLLDRDYQLRIDIETQNLLIRKSQLGILKSIIAYAAKVADGAPMYTVEWTKMLSNIDSAVVARERLQIRLRTIQRKRQLVETELHVYREAHHADGSTLDEKISDRLNKATEEVKEGEVLPKASLQDTMELINCVTLQTRDEMTGKAEFGKDNDGRTIQQIAREEGKTFGEILEEVGKEMDGVEESKGNKENANSKKNKKGEKAQKAE